MKKIDWKGLIFNQGRLIILQLPALLILLGALCSVKGLNILVGTFVFIAIVIIFLTWIWIESKVDELDKLKARLIQVRFNTNKGCFYKLFDSMEDVDSYIIRNKYKLGILAFQMEKIK